ncbi:hypothetical protein LTR10_009261 [Elasticomyces elasticus]|nr:hypothetical protein LTR10_009261 [Elasticomyces elasticus]KAK4971640.1 hypothetical protein LTR42_007368 [Elasticomyces elasticus]
MWLINAESYRLEYFMDSDIPPYAILSHTWGPGAEVTFQDMQDAKGAGPEKPSFGKIRFTCAQALADNLQYAWVDTLFRWYIDAQVCYALLLDLEIPRYITEDGRSVAVELTQWDQLPTFQSCRWFTRGWTLQELIAPVELRFYDRSGTLILPRRAFASRLSTITGISADILDWPFGLRPSVIESRNGRLISLREILSKYNVAQRMSWAARRETSRKEDVAYSLLGIFNVNMPLLYGEGDRAFVRLQEEIVRISTDHSILAWNYRLATTVISDGVFAGEPLHFQLNHLGQEKVAGANHWEMWSSDLCEISNEGLRITVRLVRNFDDSDWAVLDCALEGDLVGPLALRLGWSLTTARHYVADSNRLNTIPQELAAAAAMTPITLLSTAKGIAYSKPNQGQKNTNFRINLFGDDLITKALDLCSEKQPGLDVQLAKVQEDTSQYFKNPPPHVFTISVPGISQCANGVRVSTAKLTDDELGMIYSYDRVDPTVSRLTQILWPRKTTTMLPRTEINDTIHSIRSRLSSPSDWQTWDVMFNVRFPPNSDRANRGCDPWVRVARASGTLQAACDSATAHRSMADSKVATRTAGGITLHASITKARAKTLYWQVDIKFSLAN